MRTGRAIKESPEPPAQGIGQKPGKNWRRRAGQGDLIGERNLYHRRIHVDAREGVFHKVPWDVPYAGAQPWKKLNYFGHQPAFLFTVRFKVSLGKKSENSEGTVISEVRQRCSDTLRKTAENEMQRGGHVQSYFDQIDKAGPANIELQWFWSSHTVDQRLCTRKKVASPNVTGDISKTLSTLCS